MADHKRRIQLPKPALQLKLVLIFLILGIVCVLLQFTMLSRTLTELAMKQPGGGLAMIITVSAVLWKHLFITLCMLVPLNLLVGILVTFRIAGPIYHFEKHLLRIAEGEDPGPCRLRKWDDLQELCEAINLAVDALRTGQGNVVVNARERMSAEVGVSSDDSSPQKNADGE